MKQLKMNHIAFEKLLVEQKLVIKWIKQPVRAIIQIYFSKIVSRTGAVAPITGDFMGVWLF